MRTNPNPQKTSTIELSLSRIESKKSKKYKKSIIKNIWSIISGSY